MSDRLIEINNPYQIGFKSDERKVLLGMMRPPWHEVYAQYSGHPGSKRMVDGQCYIDARNHQNQFVTMWQLGRFDTPVYATAQEIIDRVAEKIIANTPPASADCASRAAPTSGPE